LPHHMDPYLCRTTCADGSKQVHNVVEDDETALGNAVWSPVASQVPLRAPHEVLASTISYTTFSNLRGHENRTG
jgi:hypothetical protein